MLYIAKRMQAAPQPRADRGRGALRLHARQHHARQHGRQDGRQVVPLHRRRCSCSSGSRTMIGYIPLPTNSEEKIDIFGVADPVLRALRRHGEHLDPARPRPGGVRRLQRRGHPRQGRRSATSKALVPAGVTGGMAAFIFILEVMSNFMRLISLSVRLFANILAGHLIILFMSGGLVVLLGVDWRRLAHAADRRRHLPLRGRPGRDPAGLHLRHPHCHLPRRRGRRAH